MKTILFSAGICLLGSGVWAQDMSPIRVKGGPNWQRSVANHEKYRYDQFRTGKITYLNGLAATGRFNYNILIGEMQFVDPRGDTLSLANENTIRSVQIGETAFVYDQKYGFLEILANYTSAVLAYKPIFKTIRAEKKGGYNQSSGTSSITQYKSFIGSNGQLSRLEQEGDLLLDKGTTYFLIDQNQRFYKLNRATVLKVFSKHKPAIEAYLKQENIDFQKEEDLKKMLQFCSTLT